ncbi:MAG: Ig-like domain-containing protein [Ruminococcus sp.]|nr:Ig-like domain-containing protein [Ruminococcus sp.]
MKKLISSALIIALIISCFTFAASAQSKVSIRIEGKESTFYSGEVAIGENATVLDVLKAVDNAEENVDVTVIEDSQYGAYISAINGEAQETLSVNDPENPSNTTYYYVGWMFAVDNISSSVGASAYELKGGEDIVFYYCDMNTQVPVADFSEEGKIKLTSFDYDWMSDASAWQPVAGAKVYLNDKEYTSDSEGVVTYEPADFKCLVKVQIERSDELGYPTVCRFEDNYGFDMHCFRETQPEQKPVTLNYKESLYVKGFYDIDMSTDESVSYSSSNIKVAKVSSSGRITGVKKGTATITAKAGNVTAKYKITVNNPYLSVNSKVLKKGKSFKLMVFGAIDVKFSSNKKSVATVNSSGKITAKKKGAAVITVKANGVTLKCKVTVK